MSNTFALVNVCVLVAALAATAVAPEAAQERKVAAGPGTLTAARKYLEGRWSLISFDVFRPGEAPINVRGAGTLTYDDFGNLTVEIRVSDQATERALEAAGIPITKGTFSTRGRTALDLPARTLVYFLEGQAPLGVPSGPLALNRPRYWQVEGDVLTLTTKGADGQPLSVGRWKKVP